MPSSCSVYGCFSHGYLQGETKNEFPSHSEEISVDSKITLHK